MARMSQTSSRSLSERQRENHCTAFPTKLSLSMEEEECRETTNHHFRRPSHPVHFYHHRQKKECAQTKEKKASSSDADLHDVREQQRTVQYTVYSTATL